MVLFSKVWEAIQIGRTRTVTQGTAEKQNVGRERKPSDLEDNALCSTLNPQNRPHYRLESTKRQLPGPRLLLDAEFCKTAGTAHFSSWALGLVSPSRWERSVVAGRYPLLRYRQVSKQRRSRIPFVNTFPANLRHIVSVAIPPTLLNFHLRLHTPTYLHGYRCRCRSGSPIPPPTPPPLLLLQLAPRLLLLVLLNPYTAKRPVRSSLPGFRAAMAKSFWPAAIRYLDRRRIRRFILV